MNNKNKTYIAAVAVVAVLAVIFMSSRVHHEESTKNSAPVVGDTVATVASSEDAATGSLPGLQTGTAPWIAETDNLRARLSAIGLPALSAEGTALHTHQHLDITIHGVVASVPTDIGINEKERFISPIHVHDTTGIIHVESPVVQTFTLGQFFDIWGVKFTATCIGGYCADDANSLRVYVNGELQQGNPRNIALSAHQEIYISYGTAAEVAPIIPKEYRFPAGL